MTAAVTTIGTRHGQGPDHRLPGSGTDGLPYVADASALAPKDAKALSRPFFERLAALEEGTHAYQYVRNTLVEMNLSLVRYSAARFRNRGGDPGEMEDIVQVGTIGLIKAIDRFDVSREVEFTTYAMPYIVGEIKRFFRDATWAVHVPRRLQELRIEIAQAKERLFARLDREPTVAELAGHLGLSEEQVIDGLIAGNGYTAGSLDQPADPAEVESARPLADALGEEDPRLRLAEDIHALSPLVRQLDRRDRRILTLRFVHEKTQSEIGTELGVSQMHVSRLLARILDRLRAGLTGQS
ncbi:SigB/SigF/SigG family RNA polymerase sigma factor [Streptomyces sp. GS7]|uniref:SigB/SigF/SigG family RNA polymerase sigma factor n=1 Tax=Streptomyces sp. GS7 TaxID=2692234 RepID=UPI001319764E|nr:SigB/SigF/SigG family RNA polymerase sigma factor [Streptomyces sp. GS7]QHC21961.1 SigB/SigF/SigG family RNA polymerase sigma factor [Streptomyces sp. GS7]